MTWLRTIQPEQATGDLASVYTRIGQARGGIADIHQAQSLNPRALAAHLEIYKAIVFQRSSLSRRDRERIAIVVSHNNSCAYCVAHHAEALQNVGDSPQVILALRQGEISFILPASERALLAWAKLGGLSPAECEQLHVRELQAYGFDDRAILDAALTVAYFSFVNRIVLLLGVDLEGDFTRTCEDTEP